MLCNIQCAFILATAAVILGLKLQVDGKMDFGPKWYYEYRIKPLKTKDDIPARTLPAIENQKLAYVKEYDGQPRFIDIIIKNKSNPRLIQVAEAHTFDRRDNENIEPGTEIEIDGVKNTVNIFLKHNNSDAPGGKQSAKNQLKYKKKTLPFKFSDEHPLNFSDEHTNSPKIRNAENKLTKLGKYVHHMIRIAGDVDAPKPAELEEFRETPRVISQENIYRATILMPGQKKKHKRHRMKENKTKTLSDDKQTSTDRAVTTEVVTVESFPLVPAVKNSFIIQDLYVKPRLVKDDPKIKVFTRHIYEQSIKTLESIKEKMNNYEMRKEVDQLMRSYEDKFGEFVRDTQNQRIRTRMGSQKVILNTLDTSNRILDRLVNYMIGKMDKKGILRKAGSENVILNELDKKKDLENKHICAKMQICPTNESFTKFVVDVLNTILSSADNQIIEIRDACTEVLKNTDFSNALDPDTEKRFVRGISDIEKYDVGTMRPIFFIMKNILSSKNSPIKVVGPEDGRVNKTLAFLEMLDNWDKKLPPNEQNVLEWDDMRNSFKEWKVGKRQDSADLIQHFTDHVMKVISKEDARLFDRNINTVLGF